MNYFQKDLDWFKTQLDQSSMVERLKKISLVVFDIDGTLTDGNIFKTNAQEQDELKGISMQDDFIIARALERGIKFAIVTGRENYTVKRYITDLGIQESLYFEDIDKDKFKVVLKIQEQLGLGQEQMLMFGDDFLDFEIKGYVGVYAVPANAPFYLQPQADIVTPHPGGKGALRILLDLLLFVQNKHFAQKLIDDLVRS